MAELSTPSPTLAPAAHAGWELLVGPLSGRAVVCLDDNGAAIAALAQRCARVCVVSPTREAAAILSACVAEQGWSHVNVIAQEALTAFANAPGHADFDGLVATDLSGQTRHAGGLGALALQARPLLRDGAFVLLAVPNRWGLNRERISKGFRSGNTWSWRALMRQMRQLGAQVSAIHPLLTNEQASITEVIAPNGYRATKNAGLTRENIKELLWGRRGARWFAPALACVGWIGHACGSVIDEVARALPDGSDPAQWVQYLVLLSGKVIITFTSATRSSAPRVVVVTRDPLAISRREREADTLRHLANALPTPLAALLPRVIDRFSVDGNECFVLQHIPGVTADAVVPGLAKVTHTSLGFLLELHQATHTRRVMGDDDWQRVLAPIFESAVQRHAYVAVPLRELERRMREHVLGNVWVSVCSHGDFKIENVMYDPRSFQITGVIDWEHAMLDGLPYIDVVYLLTYNRMLRGQSWLHAAHALLRGDITDEEKALEARYWQATAIPERLRATLRALVIVHHIGVRWHGQWADGAQAELVSLLNACIALLEPALSPASSLPARQTQANPHAA